MRHLLTTAFFLSLIPCQAQVTITYRDISSKQSTPRISWAFPIHYHLYFDSITHNRPTLLSPWETKKPFVSIGAEIRNSGIIFKDSCFLKKFSGISVGPCLSLTRQFFQYKKEKEDWKYRFMGFNYIRLTYGINFFFYSKEKIFEKTNPRNIVHFQKEFFSDKIVNPDQYIRLSIGTKDIYSIYAEYHFQSFLNKKHTENINGVLINPYSNYNVSNINIGVKLDALYVGGTLLAFLAVLRSWVR